jgi:hypothetical protein
METAIVIPSHKRHDRVLTKKIVADAKICVPDSQLDSYKEHNPECEIVPHPDHVIGLPAKRDWIYRHFGNVFMLDDDITKLQRVYSKDSYAINDPEVVRDIILQTAEAAKQSGAFLFGFSKNPNPSAYRSQEPIRLSGYITGCATGLLAGSNLYYDTRIKCNEDYWISCLNAHFHRIIYQDTRFVFEQKATFTSRGGLAEFRNIEAEKADFELLQKTFGDCIQLKIDTAQRKRKHPFEKTLRIPF